MTHGFLTRSLVRPLLELLRQGVTPEKLSLSIALGAVLGLIPVIGINTALCAVVALVWRLNLPAIQLVNYFVYPLQIALLLPLFRLGEKLFGAQHLPLRVEQIREMLRTNLWGALRLLGSTVWHAFVVWAIAAPFAMALIYVLLVPALRQVLKKTHAAASTGEIPAGG
ncbi:MAG TPA: DUF2062 domain-containing protein [Verrucomicrobiae bacterium]|nr:DUF2062 domain-containing protein [Verrucomicrobiae bacterium]